MATHSDNLKTQRRRVVESIQSKNIGGKLKVGEPLRQIPLSKEHEVLQSLVREGVPALEHCGLASSAVNLGFVVRKLDRREPFEHLSVVEAIADKAPNEAESLAKLHVIISAESIWLRK